MALGAKTGGRQAGTPNKVTRAAKDAIAFAAEQLGGAERLADWALEAPENEKAFWSVIYPKLLPLQLTGADGGPVQIQTIRLVPVEPRAITDDRTGD